MKTRMTGCALMLAMGVVFAPESRAQAQFFKKFKSPIRNPIRNLPIKPSRSTRIIMRGGKGLLPKNPGNWPRFGKGSRRPNPLKRDGRKLSSRWKQFGRSASQASKSAGRRWSTKYKTLGRSKSFQSFRRNRDRSLRGITFGGSTSGAGGSARGTRQESSYGTYNLRGGQPSRRGRVSRFRPSRSRSRSHRRHWRHSGVLR